MRCPDDTGSLAEGPAGVFACKRCQGRALQMARFAASHPGIGALLQPEQDLGSGAFARKRRCPRCQSVMAPMRLGQQQAWLDRCAACEVLWVEKLDEAVVQRVKRRRALERAVATMPPEEVRAAARGIAGDLAEEGRALARLPAVEALLEFLLYGGPGVF